MSEFAIFAPFAAWLAPLKEVPDEAFASGMLGMGLALDPLEGTVRAPFASEVVAVAPTGHSVTLRHECGAEMLIHIGVDTVELRGEGFEALVATGTRVASGDPILRFDLDLVARRAAGVMTPLVLIGEEFDLEVVAPGRPVAAGEKIAVVRIQHSRVTGPNAKMDGSFHSRSLKVPLLHGIHARPAARIAAALKPFEAKVAIRANGTQANARSVTALLKLDIREGTEIVLEACGTDGGDAINAVVRLVATELPELEAASGTLPATPVSPSRPLATLAGNFTGTRAAPGGASGVAVLLGHKDLEVPDEGQGPAVERAALAAAIATLRARLSETTHRNDVVSAHLAILDDPELREAAERHIAENRSAPAAWRATLQAEAALLRLSANSLLAERAADLVDVERQVLNILLGTSRHMADLPHDSVIIADELLPSAFLSLDQNRIAGIATASGGPTSHTAILAAAKGIPMLVACGGELLELQDGTPVMLDPIAPCLHVRPSAADTARFERVAADLRRQGIVQQDAATEDCFTADGKRIEVFANCGSVGDAESAASNWAEGCGLLRTEFLFLNRRQPPSSDEQAAAYAAIAQALPSRPLIVRTLDAGSDKPLPFLPARREENPALGLRGIRLSLLFLDLLEQQLTAILKGVPAAQRRIMLPMITDLSEFTVARDMLRNLEQQLHIERPTPLGVMVETPSAALMADQLAAEADFLSVGSNDLTQYVLAADRQNPAVAAAADALHPAVLRLISLAAKGAHAHGRSLGVCGNLAANEAAAPLLIGLGVNELSMVPAAIPAIKARIRRLETAQCTRLAERALKAENAAQVRQLLEETDDARAL